MTHFASTGIDLHHAHPDIRRISIADLSAAVRRGIADFSAKPSHVIFLTVIYPVVGLILARMTTDSALMPLFFPLVAGFALLGPFAALGLYELSRRREQGEEPHWSDALHVFRSPSFGSIVALGAILTGIFVAWLLVARWLANSMLAGMEMDSYGHFVQQVLTTEQGWVMIVVGNIVGLAFAVVAFSISVVAFPLLLERNVGVGAAIQTSLRAVAANPLTMALWGLFVAVVLAVASLPLFIGLAVAMPILGHATWHLYRRVVVA